VADELRALGWTVSPPEPVAPEFTHNTPLPSWLVERDDGRDGFEMLGGGRDE